MEFTAMDRLNQKQENDTHLLRMLDRGIDDMEAKRELPLEDAYATLTGCNYYHFAHVSVSSSKICSRLLVFSSVISDTGQMPCVC